MDLIKQIITSPSTKKYFSNFLINTLNEPSNYQIQQKYRPTKMGFYSNVFLHTSRPVIKCHSLNIIRIWKQCSVFKILEKSEQRKKTCQSKDIKHTLTSSSPRPFITTHVGYVQFIQLPEWRRTKTEPMVAAAEPWMKRWGKKKKNWEETVSWTFCSEFRFTSSRGWITVVRCETEKYKNSFTPAVIAQLNSYTLYGNSSKRIIYFKLFGWIFFFISPTAQ